MNISPNPPANIYSSPVTPHPPGQVVTTLLGLHKDDGFVLFLSHDLLHQLNESDDGGREATTHQKPQKTRDRTITGFVTTSQRFSNKMFPYFSSFSVSRQTSTICRMLWLALSSRAPILIWMYSFRKSSASCRTSFGQVALHIRVCLSG